MEAFARAVQPSRGMGRWKNAWKALFGDSGAPKSAGGLLTGIFPSGQGVRRGTRELLLAYRTTPWLHAVTHRIASEVAGTCWTVLAPTSGDRLPAKRVQRASGATRRVLVSKALETGDLRPLDSHPILDLLHTMNPALGGQASLHVTQAHRDIKGESFWVLERAGDGRVVQAWPVPPHWCAETPSVSSPAFRFGWMGWQRTVPEADVLWLKDPDPEMPYGRGVGTGEALADELDVDEYAAKYLKGWFTNGAMPSAIVSLEGLGEDEARRMKQQFVERFGGAGKQHQIEFTGSKLEVQQLAHTFQEQQMMGLRQQERDIILQVFGVPPEVLGIIENSNRATIDAADYLFQSGVICPRLDSLCAALQPLLNEWDERLVLSYESPIPEDREFQRQVFQSTPSVFTVDEHRALAGMPPLKDGTGGALYTGQTNPLASLLALEAKPAATKAVRKDLREADIPNILEALRPERLTDETGKLWADKVREWGERVMGKLGVDPVGFDMQNPLVQNILADSGTRITGVSETTRELIRGELLVGVRAGEGIAELAKRVEAVFGSADEYRAEMIARTEVVGSSNAANLAAFEMSGVVEGKEWLSVRDGNTREDHRELDGQMVPVREPFVSRSGARAQAPGQFGIAAQDINCRCSVLPVTELGKAHKAQLTEEEKSEAWRAFDRALVPWEKAAMAALRRGFRAQRDEVLEALRARE